MFATMTLADGRTLEYAELGDRSGRPVVFFPGTPATAGQGAVIADEARDRGVRLVAVSRPGYAGSTNASPGLTPTAGDALQLADHLGIERLATVGISGGGPYALALAALAPDRIENVSVLGGPGSHREVQWDDLDEEDRRAVELLAEGDVAGALAIMTAWCETHVVPMQGLSADRFHALLEGMRPPGEDWFDGRPDALAAFESDWQRAITPYDGFVRDNCSWLGAWDFDLAAVSAPVRIVHGADDVMVPAAHGVWLHHRLPTSEVHVVPGGHGHATFGAAPGAFAAITGR